MIVTAFHINEAKYKHNMTLTLIQMTLIMATGAIWRILSPAGLNAESTRHVLTTVVYYLFLPALVLEVLWTADIGVHSFAYTYLGLISIVATLLIIWIICFIFKIQDRKTGAILLATCFPNVTYLGLPVLEQTFGNWARSVAIQLDLFATAPLVFTLGIAIAKYYGEDEQPHQSIFSFLNAPPFLAAFIAVLLNLAGVDLPLWLSGVLQKLSSAVVPLMLFSLGLALSWQSIKFKNLPYILPVVLVKLFVMPFLALQVVVFLTLESSHKAAAVLEMAMPCMVLGIVFCDRYKLDSSLYAMSVTMTTLLSMLTLPFWYSIL